MICFQNIVSFDQIELGLLILLPGRFNFVRVLLDLILQTKFNCHISCVLIISLGKVTIILLPVT